MSEVPRFAANQIIGMRERQEDDYAALDLSGTGHERLLFVVADGMGGHAGAAAVTQAAVRRFCEIIKGCEGMLSQHLPQALTGANDAIAKAGILDGTLDGAGCAFLAAVVDEGALSWISVGDCSLLLLRDGRLRRLNADHSMRPVLAEMVAAGRLSPKAAALDPRRNSLRSALRGGEIRLVDNSPAPLFLMPGDAVILASDGCETLSTRKVVRLLRHRAGTPAVILVERLLTAIRAARLRNQDNATLVYYQPNDMALPKPGPSRGRAAFWIALATVLLAVIAYGLQISTRQ
jgi:serine/threonine protein phosphatase PrpC